MVFLAIVILLYPLWLPNVYTYFDVSQQPRSADVIVVLGGSWGRREAFAVELFRAGYASSILVSGSGYDEDSMKHGLDVVRRSDIPENALTINPLATSTYDEAQQVLKLLLKMNANSALIVTDGYHTRRALATYKHVFQGYSIDLTIVSPDDHIDPNSWWTSQFKDAIVAEILKIPYYCLVYGV